MLCCPTRSEESSNTGVKREGETDVKEEEQGPDNEADDPEEGDDGEVQVDDAGNDGHVVGDEDDVETNNDTGNGGDKSNMDRTCADNALVVLLGVLVLVLMLILSADEGGLEERFV